MRTAQIALSGVTKRYADHVVLDRVDLTISPGEKVGVIGDNGVGKSTLLKLLAGVESPDNGEVRFVAPGGVGYLTQALELPADATVQDAVDLALAELRQIEARMRTGTAVTSWPRPRSDAAGCASTRSGARRSIAAGAWSRRTRHGSTRSRGRWSSRSSRPARSGPGVGGTAR